MMRPGRELVRPKMFPLSSANFRKAPKLNVIRANKETLIWAKNTKVKERKVILLYFGKGFSIA